MKERHTELLQLLKESTQRGEYVSGYSLGKRLNVSTRTIRSDVSFLNEQYLLDSEIESNNRFGYKLVGKMKVFREQTYLEYNQRAFFIIQILIEQEHWTSYSEISEYLNVSVHTINTDITKIIKVIYEQNLDITLQTEMFSGICMIGKEMDKRILLSYFVKKNFASTDEQRHELKTLFTKWWFNESEIDMTLDYVDKVFNYFDISLKLHMKSMIVTLVLIQKHRINNKKFVEIDLNFSQKKKNLQELRVAQEILKIGNLREKQFIKDETSFLALHLIGWKLIPNSKGVQDYILSEKIDSYVNELLSILGNDNGYEFSEDFSLVLGLQMHLKRILYPLKYHIFIDNPLLSYIKSEYIQAYQISVVFSKLFSQKFSIKIPENEVGFIALHIEAALERMNNLKIKAAVIYKDNYLTATLSKQKIENNFSQIEVTDILSINELELLPSNVSLVISQDTIQKSDKKVIVVNEFLKTADLSHIKQNVTFGILRNNIRKKQVLYLNESSQEAVLKRMVEYFNLDKFYKGIIDRENLSSTDIGNEIALPHPLFSSNTDKTSIYIGINKNKILWGERSARLIFLLILSEEDKLRYEYIYREIYQLMRDRKTIENLLNTNYYDEFIENLK